MTAVENFIYEYRDHQKAVMLYLHNLLAVELNLTPNMRYGIPFYYRKSWICYLNPTKKGGVEFAFTRGNELSNAQGLLDSRGRKQVFSVEFGSVSDIPEGTVKEVIQEAILLDETIPYASKRKKSDNFN